MDFNAEQTGSPGVAHGLGVHSEMVTWVVVGLPLLGLIQLQGAGHTCPGKGTDLTKVGHCLFIRGVAGALCSHFFCVEKLLAFSSLILRYADI